MSFDDIFEQISDVIDNPVTDRSDQKTQYVAFVLDMSGSMGSVRQLAIDNFNEQLQQIRAEEEDVETRVITTVFNSFPVNMNGVEVVPLADVNELTEDTYVPDGMTALYDAMGFTINKVIREYKGDKSDTAVLFVIITDGQENNSAEFNQEQVRQMVEELEKTDRWTFTYLGANVDPLKTAVVDMSFAVNNTLSWQADAVGMRKMSDDANKGIKGYYDGRKAGMTMTSAFFSDTDDGSKTDDGTDDSRKSDDHTGGQSR